MDWRAAVAKGNFDLIPLAITWKNGGGTLATMIDGYALAQFAAISRKPMEEPNGLNLARVVNFNVRNQLGHGADVPAIDLWVAMFFESRRERFTYMPADGTLDEDPVLDIMSTKLKMALQSATPEQIKTLKEHIRPERL